MINPLSVSAVVVNWNGRQDLDSCLGSLGQLVSPPREILLVDNGSTDGSVPFVEKNYPGVQIIANASNLGFARPNLQAATQATGDLLLLLNNDMRVDSHALEPALPLFEDASVAAVGLRILDWEGKAIDFDGASLQYLGYATQKRIGQPYVSTGPEQPREELFACGGAMLVRRSVFLELGGFDPDFFAIYEDVDFGWRAWIAGLRVLFDPRALAYHRGHATLGRHASEKIRYLMHRNALLTILKNYEQANLEMIFPAAIVLAVKRALEFSRVDRNAFYLWAKQEASLEQSPQQTAQQCRDAINHLVALDDALTRIDYWLEKRAEVQARRVRPDAEITRLFSEPLRLIMDNAGYLESEWQLSRRLGFEKLFADATDPKRAVRIERQIEKRLFELQQQTRLAEATLEKLNARLRQIERRGSPVEVGAPNASGLFYRLRRFLSRIPGRSS